jgi:hypothetical protein
LGVRSSQREGELIIPSLWEGRPLRAGEGDSLSKC